MPARGAPQGRRAGPAGPARRRARAGAAEPHRRGAARRAARRRHRRLGRRLAGHRRSRESRAALAGAARAARGHRGRRAHARPPADGVPGVRRRPGTLARSADPLPGARPLGRRRVWPATTRARSGRSGTERRRTWAPAPRWCRSAGARPPGTPAPTSSRPCWCRPRPVRRGAVREVLDGARARAGAGRGGDRRRCSVRADPRWRPSPSWPTSCGPSWSATRSPTWSTGTSTTPTCAPSSARSAGSPRARCR